MAHELDLDFFKGKWMLLPVLLICCLLYRLAAQTSYGQSKDGVHTLHVKTESVCKNTHTHGNLQLGATSMQSDIKINGAELKFRDCPIHTTLYGLGPRVQTTGEKLSSNCENALEDFPPFPQNGGSSTSNNLEVIVAMIDILDWEIDWICLEERGRTKINSNTIIFYGMQQVMYAQPVFSIA